MSSLPSPSSLTMDIKSPPPSSKKRRFRGLSFSTLHNSSKFTSEGPAFPAVFITFYLDRNLAIKINCQRSLEAFKLADRPYAKQVVDDMLSNSILQNINYSMMSNVISAFVHSATVDFLNKGLLWLSVSVLINIESPLFLYGNHETLKVAAQESLEVNNIRRGEDLSDVEVLSFGRKEDELIEMSESCPICLEVLSCLDRICLGDSFSTEPKRIECTECWHLFHQNCLEQWKGRGHNECPLCRYKLTTY